jgi:hypothetical protein
MMLWWGTDLADVGSLPLWLSCGILCQHRPQSLCDWDDLILYTSFMSYASATNTWCVAPLLQSHKQSHHNLTVCSSSTLFSLNSVCNDDTCISSWGILVLFSSNLFCTSVPPTSLWMWWSCAALMLIWGVACRCIQSLQKVVIPHVVVLQPELNMYHPSTIHTIAHKGKVKTCLFFCECIEN